jgi:putative ABC transport system substrate-binding protein
MGVRIARLFVVAVAVGVFSVSFMAEAQQTKVYRVGILSQGSPLAPGSMPGILQKTLHDLGYIEGRNIVFDRRWAEGKLERFPSLATELVALKPDTIVAGTTPATIAAMRATATIPIVMTGVADPVASGLVASLARPGGNVTGVADLSTDMGVKGVELLHAVALRPHGWPFSCPTARLISPCSRRFKTRRGASASRFCPPKSNRLRNSRGRLRR